MSATLHGQVIAAHGRHYMVRLPDGSRLMCFTRGKKNNAACGDRVALERSATRQGVITEVLARDNLMYRSDAFKIKMLAANVSQLLIVVAAEPPFSDELLSRALVSAEVLEVPASILLNKIDLPDHAAAARLRLKSFQQLGYTVLEASVRADPAGTLALLRPLLAGRNTLLLGQSGMGKSSLLNVLVPDAQAATREISEVLHSGKHTTTDARLYDLPGDDGSAIGTVIDTPGFQEFGLAHLTPGQIERAFPEIRPFLGKCRFYNCSHLIEPDCAVRAAMESGAISRPRYALFATLTRDSATATAP